MTHLDDRTPGSTDLRRAVFERYPRSAWSSRATAVVTLVVVLPLAGATVLASEARSHHGFATTAELVVYPVVLGAGGLYYLYFRATECDKAGWLTLCLTVYAVQGVALAGLRAADTELVEIQSGWAAVVSLPVGILILGAVTLARGAPLRVDPMATGLALGLVIAAYCVVAHRVGPSLAATSAPVILAELALLGLGIAVARSVMRLEGLPRWCTCRLAAGAVALTVSQLAVSQPSHPVPSVIAVLAGIVGAVLLADATAASLRWVHLEQRSAVDDLSENVAEMEARDRDSRARLHEVTNSIASIAAASSLISRNGAIAPEQRRKLEEMLASESKRVARLLGGELLTVTDETGSRRTHPPTGPLLDVDEVIRPLVTAQQVLGRRVRWCPSGVLAVGDADAVAEVVSILLDNAARHAPRSVTTVEVARRETTVEIAVHAEGPGVSAGVRRRLFEWGARGPDSHGQGIGLSLAHQLMASGGNSLRLDVSGIGTTFVIGLPLPPEEKK